MSLITGLGRNTETYLRKIPSALLSLHSQTSILVFFFFLNKLLESFLSFQKYASALLWTLFLLLLLFLYCFAHSGFFQDFIFYLPAPSKGHREEKSTHSYLSFRKGNTDGVPVVTVCPQPGSHLRFGALPTVLCNTFSLRICVCVRQLCTTC